MANPTLTLAEITDMRKTISDIDDFLSKDRLTEEQMCAYIKSLNEKYPDNVVVFNLLYRQPQSGIPIKCANFQSLVSDLRWKQLYLSAKICAKSVAEMYDELRRNNNGQNEI